MKAVRWASRRHRGQDRRAHGPEAGRHEFPLELSLNAVEMNGRPQFIGSIRDQTERQRMRAMLAQSDKLASIGLLSAGVAHEINNPLAYVANNLAVLERDLKGVLEMIERSTSRPGACSRPPIPRSSGGSTTLAEEIDWPYVRENLDRMSTGPATGSSGSPTSSRSCAGWPGPRLPSGSRSRSPTWSRAPSR